MSWLWVFLAPAWAASWAVTVIVTARFDAWWYLRAARPRHVTARELKKQREKHLAHFMAFGLLGPLGLLYLGVLRTTLSIHDATVKHTISRAERRRTDLREIEGGTVQQPGTHRTLPGCDIADTWCFTHRREALGCFKDLAAGRVLPSHPCTEHNSWNCCCG